MPHLPVVVVGAGQAGLATSRLLTEAELDHVVLDRGRTAGRWESPAWESLRLLTPNWLSRLPGHGYPGSDPAGFMRAGEVAGYLRGYAAASAAPVVEDADVVSVRACGTAAAPAYRVVSTGGTWTTDAVVLATGWCDLPAVPTAAAGLGERVATLTPLTYRSPAELPDGGVLVVGASSSGAQIADELASAGRRVVLAVGDHSRLPRRYRGLDVMWWLDAMGVLDRRLDAHPDPAEVRREPSLQLAGRPDGRDVDLPSLQARGVRLVGRLLGAAGTRLWFREDLPATTARADGRLHALLARADYYATRAGLDAELDSPVEPATARVADAPTHLDLAAEGIGTVVWATGHRRAYPWLRVPVLDAAGEIVHSGGRTPAPGLHVVGMRWQSRRGSSLIDGVRHDAASVVHDVAAHLDRRARERSAA